MTTAPPRLESAHTSAGKDHCAAGGGTPMLAEVGKFYRVPCVKAKGNSLWQPSVFCGEWIPIVGPEHRDAEIVKFPNLHWHVDVRFVSKKVFHNMCWHSRGTPYGVPLTRYVSRDKTLISETETYIDSEIEFKLRKCRRDPPPYPYSKAQWLKPLAESMRGCRAVNGICPHRGLPLIGPRDGDVVTCIGHGLRWNVVTGELVS